VIREQLKLLGLYALGLVFGATCLLVLRNFCVRLIFGEESPTAASMIAPLAITMVFVGLLQALALWALASRWLKSALLYGALGLSYWIILLCVGKTPEKLLTVMPVAAGCSFVILLAVWIPSMKSRQPTAQIKP
jgi:nitrogen fixation-related uncharacterized protein